MTNVDRGTASTANRFPHIVRTPGTVGGEPRIAGTRIGVRHVVLVDRYDGGIDAVVSAYPHITRDQAREALDFYVEHRDEVDRYIAANDEES